MIPRSTIEEIKSRTDLAELIESYGIALRSAGSDDLKACCPFHQEKTPSFHVHPGKGYYHCFGCGESGNVFSFVMKQQGLGFMESLKLLAERCGVTLEEREDPEARMRSRLYDLHAQLAAFFRRCLLQTREGTAARQYLESRDLDNAICERFIVGYVPASAEALLTWAKKYSFTQDDLIAAGILLPPKYPNGRWYNRFGGRVIFSICDKSGKVVAFSARTLSADKSIAKYINSPETAIFKKSKILFALDKASSHIVKAPRREAIVCEGQIDVIRCHQHGFATAVASQGTSFTPEHADLLLRSADSAVLVFDGDAAGRKAAIRTAGIFISKAVPVRIATLPAGDDPDSLLRTKGDDAFRNALDSAESAIAFHIRVLRDQEPQPDSAAATTRISQAILETITTCPSAVMKSALVSEAAKILAVPASALAEDLRHIASHRQRATPPPPQDAPPAMIDEEEARYLALEQEQKKLSRELGIAADAPHLATPSQRDIGFCNFLYAHEGDSSLASDATFAPDEIFPDDFTRKFVSAWKSTLSNAAADPFSTLAATLSPAERKWLHGIIDSPDKTAVSEIPPSEIFRSYLRQYWTAALDNRRLRLSAKSESDMFLGLEIAQTIKQLQRVAWSKFSALVPRCLEILSSSGE
ncbi:MAG: DNA primase [Kiritimatiellae bacterium]|nr:DNA primase [Kiritimatiellia bacterium]